MSFVNTRLSDLALSADHQSLAHYLKRHSDYLIIQDLDGVCMGLVADPMTRTLDSAYLEASLALKDRFYVLTNGEHIGNRGINGILERMAGQLSQDASAYLPGLAAGGVQWKSGGADISHPGVTDQEMAFLLSLPARFDAFLRDCLSGHGFNAEQVDRAAESAVLDNPVSPTLNLNVVYDMSGDQPETYQQVQKEAELFLRGLIDAAAREGMPDSFFLHLAPNHGREHGVEVLAPAGAGNAGTTDFQFMLSGAVKEAGVLFLLNQVVYQREGVYPLGEDFNVRSAPDDVESLLAMAIGAFRPYRLPVLIGVGDTVTSTPDDKGGSRRGGSDRGFLTLLQKLGRALGTDAAVCFVDSSSGEVRRPGIPVPLPESQAQLTGISDDKDPLVLNVVFPGGYQEYIGFFTSLADAD